MKAIGCKTILTGIPPQGRSLTFRYPSFEGTYSSVAKNINEAGLKGPTFAETVSLVYDAFKNQNGEYCPQILWVLRHSWFIGFTGNLFTPIDNKRYSNGVIIQDNPLIQDNLLVMKRKALADKLDAGDPSVRYIERGKEFREKYLVGLCGEEGREKLNELASHYPSGLRFWVPDSVDIEEAKLSALMKIDWGQQQVSCWWCLLARY